MRTGELILKKRRCSYKNTSPWIKTNIYSAQEDVFQN